MNSFIFNFIFSNKIERIHLPVKMDIFILLFSLKYWKKKHVKPFLFSRIPFENKLDHFLKFSIFFSSAFAFLDVQRQKMAEWIWN